MVCFGCGTPSTVSICRRRTRDSKRGVRRLTATSQVNGLARTSKNMSVTNTRPSAGCSSRCCWRADLKSRTPCTHQMESMPSTSPARRGSTGGSNMKRIFQWSSLFALSIVGVSGGIALAQRGPAVPQMRGDGPPPEAKPFSITKTDPALDAIISPDAKLVELARGFGLTEGGLWIPEGSSGNWIFAGLLDNVIYKVTPQKQVSVFME